MPLFLPENPCEIKTTQLGHPEPVLRWPDTPLTMHKAGELSWKHAGTVRGGRAFPGNSLPLTQRQNNGRSRKGEWDGRKRLWVLTGKPFSLPHQKDLSYLSLLWVCSRVMYCSSSSLRSCRQHLSVFSKSSLALSLSLAICLTWILWAQRAVHSESSHTLHRCPPHRGSTLT